MSTTVKMLITNYTANLNASILTSNYNSSSSSSNSTNYESNHSNKLINFNGLLVLLISVSILFI